MKMLRKCFECGEAKHFLEFELSVYWDGRMIDCRQCASLEETLGRRVVKMWKSMRCASRARAHPFPAFTFMEFALWLEANGIFRIYAEFRKAGDYTKDKLPSVDRLDTTKGYSFDNMELVTWRENQSRHGKHMTSLRKKAAQVRAFL